MILRRITVTAFSVLMIGLPVLASAQSYFPSSQVVITMVLAPGTTQPSSAPIVTVKATAPSLAGTPIGSGITYSFASGFMNDTRTVAFIPGGYWITASTDTSGYYFYYSNDCTGNTRAGENVSCTITLSNTPPPSANPCVTNPSASGCVPPSVQYKGPFGPTILTCTPAYQTISAGQSATFTAKGDGSSYNWKTVDRTTLNTGNSFTTVFQTTGVQTVMVQSGTQVASCTVNVVAAAAGPITYQGAPSLVSNFIPATLPNTGFGPQESAMLAFALVLLIGAGIYVAPYVRKAISISLG